MGDEQTGIDWAALQAPIPPEYIKTRPGGFGKDLSYVDAPALMVRLDEVLTPEGWETDEELSWNGNVPTVKCCLTILTDGGRGTKVGWGSPNNVERSTSDSGRTNADGKPKKDGPIYVDDQEPVKSAASDAFRRACRKWGVGRELWLQGTPEGSSQPSSKERSTPPEGDTPRCGVEGCGGHGVVRTTRAGDHQFWGCSNWATTKCKGQFPKYHEEGEQESLGDSAPPADESSEPNKAAVTVIEILDSLGRDTNSKKMLTLGKACGELKMVMPGGGVPYKWLSGLSDEDLGRLTSALDPNQQAPSGD